MERTLKSVFVFIAATVLSVDAATVSGVVKDSASGAPISGIYVSLRTPTTTLARDTTDATGVYTLTTDSIGSIIVRARELAADANYPQKDSTVTLAMSDSKTINLLLAKIPKATLSGVVLADSATGAALAGVFVTLRSGMTSRLDTTGADGKYQFDNVTLGNYFVSASLAKYVTNNLSDTIKLTTITPVTKDIVLKSIVYSAVTGIIGSDATPSAPIAGAIVTLRSAIYTGGITRRDTTGDDGKYQFDSLPTGNYLLGITAVKFVSIVASDTIKLTTSAPATHNITMTAIIYASVSGIVVDDATPSAPITGAIVTLRPATFGGVAVFRDTTAADGKYQFDSIQNGNYTVSATATQYRTLIVGDTVKITTTQAITRNITLKLIAYSSISGMVTNSLASTPVPKALVTIRQVGSTTPAKRDSTGDDGKYSFDSTLTGTYVVTVTATNYLTEIDTQELKATPLAHSIKLMPIIWVKITGIVTDSTGKAVSGALVLFTKTGSSTSKTATTGADGSYTLDSATTGTLSVIVNGIAKVVPLAISTTASPQTVNISFKSTGISIIMQSSVLGQPMAGIGRSGNLVLSNFVGSGIVRLFDASGRQVYMHRVADFQARQELSLTGRIASGNYTLSVQNKKSIFRNRIVMP
jgi:large repetitive protein